MKNYIFNTCLGLLLLGSHVFALPSTNQLGDIQILAADDLVSMCTIEELSEAFYTLLIHFVKRPITIPRVQPCS